MDEYDNATIYDTDDNLRQIYSGKPDINGYFKRLKVRSTYASSSDMTDYICKRYGIKKENFKNYCVKYNWRDWIYYLEDGTSITFTKDEEESLKREHIDENVYCRPYKHFSVDVYGPALDELFPDSFTIIDDVLISKAIELIGNQYGSDLLATEDGDTEENAIENMIDYEGSMDGKLLVSMIISQYIAKRVNGIAVAEYD